VQAIDNAGVSNVTALGFDVTTSTTDLKALVTRYVADPQRRQTLLDQLVNAEKAVANGSNATARRKLEGFHDWIATQKWAQTDLTSAQRRVLTRDAEAVIASLR
jgi:hypothetical protein